MRVRRVVRRGGVVFEILDVGEELTDDEIEAIIRALEDVKEGRVIPWEKAKKGEC